MKNPGKKIGEIKNEKDNQKLKTKYRYENGLISTRFDRIEIGKRKENRDKKIVAIVCDTGERYLSTPLYNPEAE